MYYFFICVEVICFVAITCLLCASIYDLVKHGL